MIFDILDDIIVKKQNILDQNEELGDEFAPYLTQRWLSMYSDDFAQILNSSSNILWKSLEEKSDWYKFFLAVVPKSRKKRINYIKKNKTRIKKDNIKEIIECLSQELEISQREAKLYIEQNIVDLKQLKERYNF